MGATARAQRKKILNYLIIEAADSGLDVLHNIRCCSLPMKCLIDVQCHMPGAAQQNRVGEHILV